MNEIELRIGNIVMYDGDIVKVIGIKQTGLLCEVWLEDIYDSVDIEELKPIKLIEDILLKCGFELIYDGYYTRELYLIQDTRFDFLINKQNFELSELVYIGDTYYRNVRYLHELQNLYYAITKQELEVNL